MSSTDLSLNLQTSKQRAWAAPLALMGITLFVMIVFALHFLRPDLNPISRPVSRYAVGPYSFLMATAFFSLGVGSLALVVGLYQGIAPAARSSIGLTFLGLWGIGALISMIFRMDVEGALPTLAGTIHDISGPLMFLSLTLGVILVSWRFRLDDRWRPYFRIAMMLWVLILVGFVATFLSFITGSGLLGVIQRFTLTMMVSWMLLAASRLLIRH
jgi:hypothetical protein